MARFSSLEINKEEFSFSAGHFTIFGPTSREHLHGHNYFVSIKFNFLIDDNGLSFDYRFYKDKIHQLCDQLDRHLLLPSKSPYLQLEEEGEYFIALFNNQKMPFLKEDVIPLPITNITIEELSFWFLQKIIENPLELKQHQIEGLAISVYNGPCQSATSKWGNMA